MTEYEIPPPPTPAAVGDTVHFVAYDNEHDPTETIKVNVPAKVTAVHPSGLVALESLDPDRPFTEPVVAQDEELDTGGTYHWPR